MAYAADPHPAVFDLPSRDTRERRRDTAVELHEDVAVAPLVARLRGVRAVTAMPVLRAALARLERQRPERADAIALARLLLAWSARWPDATWDVSATGTALDAVAARDFGDVDVRVDVALAPAPNHVERKRVCTVRRNCSGRPAMVGARVSREVHELFEDRGARAGASAGEVLECVGRALLHGMTFAQLRDRLAEHDRLAERR
jgi:hypothetical protein